MAPSVGLDFDECLAQGYSLVPFIILFEVILKERIKMRDVSNTVRMYIEKARVAFYEGVAKHEIQTGGTLFRPSFLKLLPKLIELRAQGKLRKVFIYSNNKIKQTLDAADYILTFILKSNPYNVKSEYFTLENNEPHVLTPRIHLNHRCRVNSEQTDSGGVFREKTLAGIRECLGENISESELLFFDDQKTHVSLQESIGSKFVLVDPYRVIMSNKILGEIFLQSFDARQAFSPETELSKLILTEINKFMWIGSGEKPGFRPNGRETLGDLLKKFTPILNKFSPKAVRAVARWKDDHINSDYNILLKSVKTLLEARPDTNKIRTASPLRTPTSIAFGGALSRFTRRLRKRD
jgi:hypothetical protein